MRQAGPRRKLDDPHVTDRPRASPLAGDQENAANSARRKRGDVNELGIAERDDGDDERAVIKPYARLQGAFDLAGEREGQEIRITRLAESHDAAHEEHE